MNELIAFMLPPAVALVGMRLVRWLLGSAVNVRLGSGLRLALGLAVGMLVFSQAELLGALARVSCAAVLAWAGLVWGLVELVLLAPSLWSAAQRVRLRRAHLWLLLLVPVLYSWWVFGRLSVVEGTLEFDAASFWVFKAKVLYLEQGQDLLPWMRQPGFADAHWEYPMLVPGLYTLNYGAVGAVDEFINKVWPFWMMVALCLGVLSLGKVWARPHPLPLAAITVLCFLPASLVFIRQEGGTVPLTFFVSLTALLFAKAISEDNEISFSAALLCAAGCSSTKFEGMIFAAVSCFVMFPIGWRRGWLSKPVLHKCALVAIICLLPYAWYRLERPVAHTEVGWWRAGIATPGAALHRFPQVFFLNLSSRFFNRDVCHWVPGADDHLHWAGAWTGIGSFVNEEYACLPWLLLVLLALSLWQGRNLAVGCLTTAMLGTFTLISLAMACLPDVQNDLSAAIGFGCNVVGRYYYPFFAAWFLVLAAAWFPQETPPTVAAPLKPPRNPAHATKQQLPG